jgi:hypothetical protein
MASTTAPHSPPLVRGTLKRSAHDGLYLIVGLPLGIVSFTFAVTGIALALGLAVTLVGIPVLLATLVLARGMAVLERRRAAPVLGAVIPSSERRWRGGVLARTRAAFTDLAAWRDLLWAVLLLPLGVAGFTVAVTLWSVALGFASSPLWYWALPRGDETIPLLDDLSLPYAALRVAIGLVLIPVAAVACRGLAQGTARLARAALGRAGDLG